MGWFSRLPTSNDPPREHSKWGSQSDVMDDIACLLSGTAKRCRECKKPTMLKHLNDQGHCPDCRGKDGH